MSIFSQQDGTLLALEKMRDKLRARQRVTDCGKNEKKKISFLLSIAMNRLHSRNEIFTYSVVGWKLVYMHGNMHRRPEAIQCCGEMSRWLRLAAQRNRRWAACR
jgi:hypothetical protein